MENRCASNDTAVGRDVHDGLCSLWDSLGSIDLDFFKLQRELTVRMTGDEISPSKDFLQKQNGSFLAGECALYVCQSDLNYTC